MRTSLFILFLVGFILPIHAQEFNVTVNVDAEQTGQPNLQVFRTLKTEVEDLINTTNWTNDEYKNQERINANFTFVVSGFDNDLFTSSLQIQASRPVYGSTYSTPIYNYNDNAATFEYKEFENLRFNLNNFESNLVSIIAYHVYTILGIDAGTYAPNGGLEHFKTATQIINTASSSNFGGWRATDGLQSRFRFNDALISNVFKEYHEAMYTYHREGLDIMHDDQKTAKVKIMESIETLKKINDRRPNSFIVRVFFDAKVDEIASIFSGGPNVDITKLLDNLTRLAPTRQKAWNDIKF